MLCPVAAIVAAALPVALARSMQIAAYSIPVAFNKFLALDKCTNPAGFDIQNLTVWTPAAGNNASTVLDFGYFDESTLLQTSCHLNATSRSVAKPGYTARYACDNPIVEFIWQESTLTMIEVACPDSTGSTRWEAAGSAAPALGCTNTTCGYTYGDGQYCRATVADYQANFTSLQPSPP